MAEKKTKEQSYEELLKAMSEGEFGMAKYLWEFLERIEDTADIPGKKIETFQKTIDAFIANFKDRKDGKDGAQGPQGPQGKRGPKGDTVVGPPGPAGRDGVDGFDGKDGKQGPAGPMPAHEWDGTKIRFEVAPGEWGAWVDLRGPMGPTGQSYGPGEGGFGGGLARIRGTDFEMNGVSQIYLGNNLTATRLGDGSVRIDAQGGSSGVNLITEELTGTQSGANVTLDLTDLSQVYDTVQFVTRQGQILSASDWSQVGDIITVTNADASEKFSVQVTY